MVVGVVVVEFTVGIVFVVEMAAVGLIVFSAGGAVLVVGGVVGVVVVVVVGVEVVEFAVEIVFVVEMATAGLIVFSVGWVVVFSEVVDVGVVEVSTVIIQDKK